MAISSDVAVGSDLPATRSVGSALLALTKPRIIELLLVTTVPAMMLASRGWPGTGLMAATLVGGALSAAGANVLNCYFDRDIDARMRRTASRPLPRGDLAPTTALLFGMVLGIAGFLWLLTTVNLLTAALTTSALVFYVLVYTVWLKRRSDQNIVIGGAAGAVPVLAGWAAATGRLDLAAWILFAVVFYWTPAHFWALALRFEHHYSAAAVPMLPATRGTRITTMNVVAYAALTAYASLLLIPFGDMGWLYTITAPILGAWFVVESWAVHRAPARAMTLFVRSTHYLALLSGVIAADTLLQ